MFSRSQLFATRLRSKAFVHTVPCAHVVADAQRVNVSLANQQYVGKVIDVDFDQDLALLRIPATGLTPVSLADSDGVQQAQDVHAVGFPMADVLGKDVKVTRGTVSGTLEDERRKRFQIDAAVNPGNSGGPVLDQRGRAIGVASAKLSGIEKLRPPIPPESRN